MIHLNRYKWFYAALGFWFFLSTWTAWALLYSSRFEPAADSKFSVLINGFKVNFRMTDLSESLPESAAETAALWKEQGWLCAGGGADLAPILLGLPEEASRWISPLVQLKIFRRGGDWRLLVFFRLPSNGKTRQWTADLPGKALSDGGSSPAGFPLKPPSGASGIFKIQSGLTEALFWSPPAGRPASKFFIDYYTSNGFSGRRLSDEAGTEAFLLRKGTAQILAVVNNFENKVVLFSIR